ncbi:MAG: hypothetical protein JW920_07370 [Deltaproteobacteria bacterium]|nr:hypothetical protein [Deltaproteobacteria bacterium]
MCEQIATICIMADFGNGPYAWIRDPETAKPLVGPNIADAICGFPEDFGVSKGLHKQFANWVIDFENHYDDKGFNWEEWNQISIELCKMFKKEIGDRFLVEYHYPWEDPRYEGNPPIIDIK